MKKSLIGLLVLGSISAFAGECTMLLFENGSLGAPVTGQSSLKKCLKTAAVLLENNQAKKNPTVVVSHSDLENELYIRLRDGLVVER